MIEYETGTIVVNNVRIDKTLTLEQFHNSNFKGAEFDGFNYVVPLNSEGISNLKLKFEDVLKEVIIIPSRDDVGAAGKLKRKETELLKVFPSVTEKRYVDKKDKYLDSKIFRTYYGGVEICVVGKSFFDNDYYERIFYK